MNPLDQLSYEMLLFLEESTYSNQDWMGYTGAQFYEEIRDTLVKKIKEKKNQYVYVYVPAHLIHFCK